MRILFVMRHGGYVRNFEWVLRALAERGHQVQLGFERGRAKGMEERIERGRGGFDLPDKLREETGSAVDHDLVPTREDRWRGLAFGLRQSVSYLRYLSPAYRDATKLRERWARGTPRVVVMLGQVSWLRGPLERALRWAERRVPRSAEVDDHLRAGGYDAVLITPLVDGPSQHDWLRSAQAAGIPTARTSGTRSSGGRPSSCTVSTRTGSRRSAPTPSTTGSSGSRAPGARTSCGWWD